MKTKMAVLLALVVCLGCASTPQPAAVEGDDKGPREGCHTPLGFIPEGRTATGYLHQIESAGQRCQQGTLSCDGGVWSGGYIYPSCTMVP